ncbi:MAG: potassium transporter [Nitrospirae bacterium RBG_13_43_8]|nr:MAG: potassium transporter [Nitrospirae bacterium RBG_13_43_8]
MAVSIALIVLLGLFSDYLFNRIKLPGLLGMLIIGILCGPHVFNMIKPELLKVSADLRMVALIVILLRAGLELRKDTLKRVGKTALVMSCVPAIFEGGVILFLAPILLGISYLEAAILGAIIAAVSPAVVVPLMIKFIDKKKGTKKGIPTLLLGASSVDDVFVIVIFFILIGMYTGSNTNALMKLVEIPESIILGIAVGALSGYILYHLFEKYKLRATKMTIVVMAVAVLLTWLEENLKTKIAMSALLGVMTLGFILLEKTEIRAHKISQKLSKVWIFAEILLFVLVGAQVDIKVAWDAGLAGAALIFIALIGRSIGTYLSVMGTDFNFKERLFCVISYIPKATVQAAIGAIPLEMGVKSGNIILAVAVLSILLTAPIGAIGIMITGERWLEKEKDQKHH